MKCKLELSLLGTPEIQKAGLPVTGFTSNKVFALFCYLAVTGETHLRPALAGLLWGEFPETNAQNNLRKALSNLRKIVGPYVNITRQTVAFNQNSLHWLDIGDFETKVGNSNPETEIQQIEAAIDLYRGDFLAGFYVHQAPAFEDWVLIQRARLRNLALQALHTLTIHYTRLGREHYPTAIKCARRRLRLEPFQEEAHRQLMLLLGLDGQRSAALAQYKTCAQILAEELDIPPGEDTRRLYEQIRDDQLEPLPALPLFLTQEREHEKHPLFIGRDSDLDILGKALKEVRSGQGRVVFVTGGAGRGKTALLDEFARRAMAAQPDLLVAKGRCSAYSGVGDPHAPFREILGMLAGDVEAQWKAGAISTEHARQLWGAMPLTAHAMIERGPHILNTLVDGSALCSRMHAVSAPVISDRLKRLRERVENFKLTQTGFEQRDLFEQVTRVLGRLSQKQPLLLILDDLQWMDKASGGLLFHLGCRLPGKRILIICAYRPEEVHLSQDKMDSEDGNMHPLEKILTEFRLQFGDPWIDLAESDKIEGRSFINAYLDSEPNRLGQGFREVLYQRTAGHPLFTIELLRMMRAERNLVRGSDGSWLVETEPDWGQLPDRVESVIGQRINRLDPELQDILRVASVEGDIFTAQVIAEVQGMAEFRVLRLLSGVLDKQHRLVNANREISVGEHRLSQYDFAHILYRDYTYQCLSPGEQRLLHHRIGSTLEEFFQERTDEIVVELAHHFAGNPQKERHYCRLAGERAASEFANEEAIHYLSRALELTPDSEVSERYTLLFNREKVYDLLGERQAQEQDLIALSEAAVALKDPHKQASVALRYANFAWVLGSYTEAISKCQTALSFLNSNPDSEIEAGILRRWALSLSVLGDYEEARSMLEQAVSKARIAGSLWLEGESLRHIGNNYLIIYKPQLAIPYFENALPLLREVGDRSDEIRVLHSTALTYILLFEYQKAKDTWEQALQISREVGSTFYENAIQDSLASVFEACGLYNIALEHYKTSLEMSRQIGYRSREIRALCGIGLNLHCLNESQEGLGYIQEALILAREIKERYVEAGILGALGNVFMALNRPREAVEAFQESLQLHQELGQESLTLEPLACIAQIRLQEGDLPQAMTCAGEVYSHLEAGVIPNTSTEQPLQIYLACYQVFQANHDPRAKALLTKAHNLLQELAANIEEEELRTSFLENVAANRAILEAWKTEVKTCSTAGSAQAA